MKDSPEQTTLYEKLLPGKISAEGFLGTDHRKPQDIIRDDSDTVDRLGASHAGIALRMRCLTETGTAGLGRPVTVGGRLEVIVTEVMGTIPCPFSDNFRAAKRLTSIIDLAAGRSISWTDLNIHMIEDHGFYEGHGSFFRVDPAELLSIVGLEPECPLPKPV